MEFKDYHQILGVDKSASTDDIKKAFRKLARKYHPVVSKEPDAGARMAEVNEANTVLSDPEKRAAYDTVGAQAWAAGARSGDDVRPPPGWNEGFEFSGGDPNAQDFRHAFHGQFGDDADEHSDFFEQMFGRAARAQAHRPRRTDRTAGRRRTDARTIGPRHAPGTRVGAHPCRGRRAAARPRPSRRRMALCQHHLAARPPHLRPGTPLRRRPATGSALAQERQHQETHGTEAQEREDDAQSGEQDVANQALRNVNVDRIADIQRALEKISEGTYGYSDESGDPIPLGRLEAVPEAIYTVEEESRRESGR